MSDLRKEKSRASQEEFPETVGDKADHKLRARRERERGVWFGLGTIGMVGWSIAIPAVIGALVGRWIDANWPGPISWTLVLLLVGLAAGCLNAWRWVEREMEEIERDRKEQDNE
jgi:ATP synthase protein I